MILEPIEKQNILDLMSNYKNLHEEIAKVEKTITELTSSLKELYKVQGGITKDLEDTRDKEATLIKMLVEKYGEGRLDTQNFEWITNNK